MIRRVDPLGRRSVADLLPWWALVAEGVVQTKDEAFIGAWSYKGPDLASATQLELLAMSLGINQVLKPFGSRFVFHFDLIRQESEPVTGVEHFPRGAAQVLEARRQEQLAREKSFENRYVVCLTMHTKRHKARFWQRLLEPVDWKTELSNFEERMANLEDGLRSFVQIKRLDSAGLLRHLHFCFSGLDHPVEPPLRSIDLDSLLASGDLIGGTAPEVGAKRLRCLSLSGLPRLSSPALLDGVGDLPFPLRWSTRFIPIDDPDAEKKIAGIAKAWYLNRLSFLSHVRSSIGNGDDPARRDERERQANLGSLALEADAKRAQAERTAGGVSFGYITDTVVLHREPSADPALDGDVREVRRAFQDAGLVMSVESANSVDAFMGSLPGNSIANLRRPMISTRNLADVVPATSIFAGNRYCPSSYYPPKSPPLFVAKSGHTPFWGNLAVSDVLHAAVIGPVGEGKSVLLSFLAFSFLRYEGSQVFIFDKRMSALPLCLAVGGTHYDLLDESGEMMSFAPLGRVDERAERSWARGWLESLVKSSGLRVSPEVSRAIDDGLGELAGCSAGRTLGQFVLLVQNQEVRDALRAFTIEGGSSLLDAAHDSLTDARLQVFELARLIESEGKFVAPTLSYLFHRVLGRLDGQPSLLIVDEAWSFLADENFGPELLKLVKEARKLNAGVVLGTQSIEDFSSAGPELLDNVPTRVFLRNVNARTPNGRGKLLGLGLNDRQVEIISRLRSKGEYFWLSPEGRRVVDLRLDPGLLSVIGKTGPRDLRRIKELVQECGERWIERWLHECGEPAIAEAIAQQMEVSRAKKSKGGRDGCDAFFPGASATLCTATVTNRPGGEP